MKKNYTYLLSLLGIGAIILLQSYSDGPANNGFGATGAPGDGPNTCITCHSGGNFGTVDISLELEDANGNVVNEYSPGDTYTLNVVVSNSSGNPGGYGFQVLSLDNANSNTGTWLNPSSNAQISTANGGRSYAEQTNLSASNTFTVEWRAPSAGTGTVNFYGAGNVVNGNGNALGDSPVLGDFSINEMAGDTTDTSNSIAEIGIQSLQMFPNPVVSQLNVRSEGFNDVIQIWSANGRLIKEAVIRSNTAVDFSDLKTGIYFVTLKGEEGIEKVIKL